MNYNNIDNEWDQQLRDALADMPAPTDEEIEEMVTVMSELNDNGDYDGEVRYRGFSYEE